MNRIVVLLFALLIGSGAQAAGGGNMFGFNFGFGVPFLSQAGLNFVSSSKMFSAEAGYGNFNITIGDVGVDLTKMELSLRYHPFAGSFYLGLGFGQESFTAKGMNTISSQSVTVQSKITATTMSPQLGWMWGMDDGGFWAGMDVQMLSPSGAKTDTTTNASAGIQSTAEYQQLIKDTNAEGDKFGSTSYSALTFLRIGYLF